MPAPVPAGYHSVTPYLLVPDVAAEIDFLRRAFGAEVSQQMDGPDGEPNHAEVRIGDSPVMMGRSSEQYPAMSAMLYLYVGDCDAVHARAVEAGGESVMPPTDMFYGDRSGGVRDLHGNQWWIATRKEDLTEEELRKRAEAQGR